MKRIVSFLICAILFVSIASAQPKFTVDASKAAGKVSPRLYGLMTEEINHSYDGGLYAELIRNRAFLDNNKSPVFWSAVTKGDSEAAIELDPANPLNDKLTTSLRLSVTKAAKDRPAGVANAGYWGIPVQPITGYRAAIWAKADAGFTGPLTVAIADTDGGVSYAAGTIARMGASWQRYEVVLKTGKVAPTTHAKFVITLTQPGTVWLGLVSLFPPTWNDRPNGLRKDLMQLLVDLNPKFLRFPGGNYLEGVSAAERFAWKQTIGPIEQRPGHPCVWGYRSSDGMGLLEFLEWCEDMKAEPVLAVFAGYSLDSQHRKAGADLEPFVQEAVDEIEYVMGDVKSTWGARRARDGHPAPFKLNYVEIGNEDYFDKSKSYDERFTQFFDAIKAKYPRLKLISTIAGNQDAALRVKSRRPDVLDEHYYSSTDEFVKMAMTYGRDFDRSGPEIFLGEWATHEDATARPWDGGSQKLAPTPAFKTAIGDAALMASMERNSDIITMHCYAPLFVNVNEGARQWRPNLIGYDALSAYGSPSYYTIQLFSRNVGDEILAVASPETSVQGSATRDGKTGEIFIKLVNPKAAEARLVISIAGVKSLSPEGSAVTLSGCVEDTNSICRPRNVVPVTTALRQLKPEFSYVVPGYGIVLLKLKSRP